MVTGSTPGSAPIAAPVVVPGGAAAPAQQTETAQQPESAEAEVVPAPVEDDDEVDDRTVVVARKAAWVLELSDGRELELVGDDIVLGRKPSAIDGSEVLVVPDATRTLSKSHARLRRDGDGWTIEDLGSTNGVFVFDEADAQIELAPGSPQSASEHLILGTLEVRLREAR